MFDFREDSKNNKVIPYISNEILNILYSLDTACFFEVKRYQYEVSFSDFEIITSVRYSDVLQNFKLKKVTERITENAHQYDESELIYFSIRHLIHHCWKLDIFFLLHLRECLEANSNWDYILRAVSMNEEHLHDQPYWLRNELPGLIQGADCDFVDIIKKIEFVMIKSNTIFPKCSLLGTGQNSHYFVQMDSGIYPFLFEWIFLILSGFRVNQFSINSNLMRTTEPVKTGAKLMLAVSDIIHGHSSAFNLPVTTFSFSPNDYYIAKEIVTCQIGFLLRHECGHIYATEKHMLMKDKEEELFADEFAMKMLSKSKSSIVCLSRKDGSFINDIQSGSEINRLLEDIELLFLFYDMFFYASTILGYEDESDSSHPHIYERRLYLKEKYPEKDPVDLLNYAESFIDQVKEEMQRNERNRNRYALQ